MKLLLIYNAFWHKTEPYYVQKFNAACQRYKIEFEKKTNADFLVTDGQIARIDADIVLFFDKDVILARAIERQFAESGNRQRILNLPSAIEICDNKILQNEGLAGIVPMPKTIYEPKRFNGESSNCNWLSEVGKSLNFPLVVKECSGSFGKQVYLAKDMVELQKIYCERNSNQLLFQEFIKNSYGQDLRIFVAFGEVLGAIKRVAKAGEFRANCELGASAYVHEITEQESKIALLCANELQLDFCGVDLLLDDTKRLVCEVNANPGFLYLNEVLNIDIADKIVTKIFFDKNFKNQSKNN